MEKIQPVIELVIVGNEILANPSRDRNSHILVKNLVSAGFPVQFIAVVGDARDDIIGVFGTAARRSDVVLVTGGLGPTSDDLTVSALADAFKRELAFDEEVMTLIRDRFRRRNRPMSESNRKQAMIPVGAQVIPNEWGTAPGIYLRAEHADFYLMPGVPREMERMFSEKVLPRLRDEYLSTIVEVEILSVSGTTESELYDRICRIPGVRDSVFFYPSPTGITVRIVTTEDASWSARTLRVQIVEELGDLVYAASETSMEEVVGALLAERRLTIAVAESCTGGLVMHRLTNIPGSSRYVLCGVIAYSNESKTNLLGVDAGIIEAHGAVSAEVAVAMASGIRERTGADIGVSTTGIAGPGGGSADKPVGLMYCGISTGERTVTKKLQFVEDRIINKGRMSQTVLDKVRAYLLQGDREEI